MTGGRSGRTRRLAIKRKREHPPSTLGPIGTDWRAAVDAWCREREARAAFYR